MREKIKDKGRLEHIMDAINGIMTDKELYSLEQVKSSTILFYGFTKNLIQKSIGARLKVCGMFWFMAITQLTLIVYGIRYRMTSRC